MKTTDRAPDIVIEGNPRAPGRYTCPSCGAHFSPPEWPSAGLIVECCGILVEMLADQTTY